MIGYVARRIVFALSLVWGVSFFAFVIFGLSFDPLWQFALCRPGCDPQRNALIAKFHLHDSILHRYWIWLTGLPSHGFGQAAVPQFRSATQDIGPPLLHGAGVTAQLMAAGLVLTLVFSVLVGVVSARRGGLADAGLRLLAYVSWSLPTFLTGVLLALWLLPTGWFASAILPGAGVVHWIRLMALPAVTLALGLVGLYSRYVRSALAAELRRQYAVVARAKGLSDSRVVYRHALRNSLVPFVSVLSLDIGAVLGACFASEWVFHLQGLASYFVASMSNADPFVLTAIVAMVAVLVAAFALVTDLLIAWLDPRTPLANA
ncbi:MAG TPA: ABC transporter permease [Gaiellaceae bacterium]|nr:ABC transporter permease [Gaiellaceae bacterium]